MCALPIQAAPRLDEKVRKSSLSSVPVQTEAEHLRSSLLDIAQSYGERTYVPYVWGGNAIGDQADCESCRACIESKKHLPVKKRRSACQVCKRCGVDCSHFVHRLMNEAGLDYPYLATQRLKGMSAAHLRDYNLVDIGRDLRRARPGDLLLQDHHIVMLLAMNDLDEGDLIHVSRSIKHGRVGGIEILRRMNIAHLRGKVVRILRHVALDSGSTDFPPIPNFRHIYPRTVGTGVTRLVLAP
jgi:hypothetical protein